MHLLALLVTLSVSPASIPANGYSTVQWNGTAPCTATAVPAYAPWSGDKQASWSQSVAPQVTTVLTLTCADGSASTTLTVAGSPPPPPPPPPVVTYGTTLTWTPSTDPVASYKLYWGQTQGAYTNSIGIPATATTYAVTGLTEGTWYFQMSSIGTNGAEGPLSNIATKIVGGTTPTPVDCVVSDWTLGTPQPAICPTNGQQQRTDSRTILTQPENGGLACPPLSQTVPVTCTPPPPPDPCVVTPLTITSVTWPTSRTGRRSLGWNASQGIVGMTYNWLPNAKQTAQWVDNRGCIVNLTH